MGEVRRRPARDALLGGPTLDKWTSGRNRNRGRASSLADGRRGARRNRTVSARASDAAGRNAHVAVGPPQEGMPRREIDAGSRAREASRRRERGDRDERRRGEGAPSTSTWMKNRDARPRRCPFTGMWPTDSASIAARGMGAGARAAFRARGAAPGCFPDEGVTSKCSAGVLQRTAHLACTHFGQLLPV